MRTSHRCPKCGHGEIMYIPEPRDTGQDRLAVGGTRSVWLGGEHGALEAFVCMKCGYTELYVKSVKELDITRLPNAQILKAGDTGDPYR